MTSTFDPAPPPSPAAPAVDELPLSTKVQALLGNEVAVALLERGCTYDELVEVLGKTLRRVKSTLADADRAGLVVRVRPVDPETGAPRQAIVTLRRLSGTSAA